MSWKVTMALDSILRIGLTLLVLGGIASAAIICEAECPRKQGYTIETPTTSDGK